MSLSLKNLFSATIFSAQSIEKIAEATAEKELTLLDERFGGRNPDAT
ncbi:hypothetical protein J6O86_02380 [bacterium]|nr:hypothetical protein [bacterium]